MEKGKRIMVEDNVDFNKKKHVLPRPSSIVIRDGGSLNVGERSESLLNVGERAVGVDNVGGNMVVRTRFVVLGLSTCDNLNQQPLALANRNQPTFLTPPTSLRKPKSDVKITNCILDFEFACIVDQLLVTTSIEGLMLKWCIQYKLLKF
ncbi:hypothetical protein Tco_0149738 [Tanacetum coccineum]